MKRTKTKHKVGTPLSLQKARAISNMIHLLIQTTMSNAYENLTRGHVVNVCRKKLSVTF